MGFAIEANTGITILWLLEEPSIEDNKKISEISENSINSDTDEMM